MTTFEFEGKQFECDETVLTQYTFMADVLVADENPVACIHCFEALFAGRDREYAKAIGNTPAGMGELLKAAIEAVGEQAKNS